MILIDNNLLKPKIRKIYSDQFGFATHQMLSKIHEVNWLYSNVVLFCHGEHMVRMTPKAERVRGRCVIST